MFRPHDDGCAGAGRRAASSPHPVSRNVDVALPEGSISGFLVFGFISLHLVWNDVHGVDQAQAFAHAALTNDFLNLRRDVDEATQAPELLRGQTLSNRK